MLKDFIQRHKDEEDINIIFIDKEKKAFNSIQTKNDLDAWIEARYMAGKHNCILIDEVQDIDQFEDSVCNWYTEDNTDVILTGSNVISATPLLTQRDENGITHLSLRNFLKKGFCF